MHTAHNQSNVSIKAISTHWDPATHGHGHQNQPHLQLGSLFCILDTFSKFRPRRCFGLATKLLNPCHQIHCSKAVPQRNTVVMWSNHSDKQKELQDLRVQGTTHIVVGVPLRHAAEGTSTAEF